MKSESQIGNKQSVRVFISNNIIITGMPDEFKKTFKKTLTLSNPLYYKLVRSGNTRAVFATPKEFKYYLENGDQFIVPRGMKERVLNYFKSKKVEYKLVYDVISIPVPAMSGKDVTLRNYQESIVKKVLEDNNHEGIISSSTGSGKTMIMLELIYKLGLTATILVPNTLILRQIEREARTFYGMQTSIIGDGEKNIDNITISTFQSLYNNVHLLKRLSDNTSILIIDECHGVVSDERQKVIKQFRPTYLFGFSATLDREDGKAKAIGFLLGNVIAEYKATLLNPEIDIHYSNSKIHVTDYHEMVKIMTEDESRNKLITSMAIIELLEDKKLLILTKRIAHAELLYNLLPDSEKKFLIASDDNDRHDTLALLKSGLVEFNCIVGTTALLSQGFDLPQLDTLLLSCDMRSGILTQQSVGRILRLFTNKKQPKIIDIVDNHNPFFARQAKARQHIYKTCGWKVNSKYDF